MMHQHHASQLPPVPRLEDFPHLMITLDDSPLDPSTSAMLASHSNWSPEDVSLFGAPLGAPNHSRKRGTRSVDLTRRGAISRASGYNQWRHSLVSPKPLELASSNLHGAFAAEFEGIVRAPPTPTTAASPPSSPPTTPSSPTSFLSSANSLRARWRAPPRVKRHVHDRQLTFLTELSDSDCEDDEDEEHAELYAQAAALLRVRLTATVEAQRMARADMRRSGGALGLGDLADTPEDDEIDD